MRKSITYKFLIYICIYICEFRFVTELIQVLSILIFTNFKLIIFKNQTSVYLNICFQSKFLHGRNIDSTINFNNNLDIEFIIDLTVVNFDFVSSIIDHKYKPIITDFPRKMLLLKPATSTNF